MKKEYDKLSKYYDILHNEKDYQSECDYFSKIILKNKKSQGNNLLDLACGTGEHIKFFKRNFVCEWLDSSKKMIEIAKNKNPEINFYVDDMTSFNLDKKYDIITILFNSIWYLDKEQLKKTVKNAYIHLNEWGIFLIETVFLKGKFNMTENKRAYKDKNLDIFREVWIEHRKDSVTLKSKYKINSEKFIEEDEQEIVLLEEDELKDFFMSENFELNVYYYEHNKSTLFLGIK